MNYNWIERSKVPLKHYQIKTGKFINHEKNESLMLIFPTGSGKTISVISASQCFLDLKKDRKVIVICSKTLKNNFTKELEKYGAINRDKYEIYTYHKILHNYKKYKTRTDNPIICDENTMIIIDEVHNLKTFYNKITKKDGALYVAIFDFIKLSKKRLLLTATPFINDITDFTVLVNLLHNRKILGRYAEVKTGVVENALAPLTQPHINGVNKHILDSKLNKKIYYLKGFDVSEYPTFAKHVIEVCMTPEYEKKYKDVMRRLESFDLVKFEGDPLPFYNGDRRIVNKVNEEGGLDDFSMKLTKLENIGCFEKKTLIYTNWIEFGLSPISKYLKNKNITYKIFFGKLSEQERIDTINEFNNNEFQVLIITKAGGIGIDLREVQNVVIMDPNWNEPMQDQVIGRAIRYKSHVNLAPENKHVNIYYMILTGKNTITGDQIVYDIIKRKNILSEKISEMYEYLTI